MIFLILMCLIFGIFSSGTCNDSDVFIKDVALKPALSLKKDVVKADITINNLIRALEKVVFYYFKHKKDATVDFAFGLRAAEGEIFRILHMAETGAFPDAAIDVDRMQKLKEIKQSIQLNIKQSLPFVEKRNRKYFYAFFPMFKERWNAFQFEPQLSIPDIDSFPNITGLGDITETESDRCMMDILGKAKTAECNINSCWKRMTRMGTSRYYITHQIFWLLLGDKMGCRQEMDNIAKKEGFANGISDIIKKKCASVIIEMEAIVQNGVRVGLTDLFLEQGFVCGSIGFIDAVRPEWLKLVFQWQDPTLGCFPDKDSETDDETEFQFWINLKREQWKSRNLLLNTFLNDGCSTHKSAVGVAFFATYLRLFYDPVYKKTQLDPHISPQNFDSSTGSYGRFSMVKLVSFCFIIFLIIFLELRKRFLFQVYRTCCRKCRFKALLRAPSFV